MTDDEILIYAKTMTKAMIVEFARVIAAKEREACKREWRGLTDEEIEHIWGITAPDYVDKFALPRMIEAKLKEKNT